MVSPLQAAPHMRCVDMSLVSRSPASKVSYTSCVEGKTYAVCVHMQDKYSSHKGVCKLRSPVVATKRQRSFSVVSYAAHEKEG